MLGDFRGFGAGEIAKTLPMKMGVGKFWGHGFNIRAKKR